MQKLSFFDYFCILIVIFNMKKNIVSIISDTQIIVLYVHD